MVAIDIHPADKELCHWFLNNATPIRSMSMGIATSVNACVAEEFVTLEAQEVPDIITYFLGADATASLGRIWGVFQLVK